ncbi:MAG TPA: urea ABC transporter ATP-binding protein UrtD [Terriglobia bacterium]|nr:urea ABC transporter ATP-binding protein UrtD [Terriglobia bacterium]
MNQPLLRVENLTVSFEGFKALDRMCLALMPRTVRVLIGPNGAGKSTLLDAITGRVRPTAGEVVFKGENITRLDEHKIARRGICRKFQAPGILDNLTVYENLALAACPRREWWFNLTSNVTPAVRTQVEKVLNLIGLEEKMDSLAKHLAHGQKQWLEIGMVVASDAELLLLDEPAAGMTHREAAQTADLIRSLSDRHSFLVIDHDMTFVDQLKAPVSVLHMGRLLKEGSLEEVRSDPQVAAVYLGRVEEVPSGYA